VLITMRLNQKPLSVRDRPERRPTETEFERRYYVKYPTITEIVLGESYYIMRSIKVAAFK
jgi:hypothetical protein